MCECISMTKSMLRTKRFFGSFEVKRLLQKTKGDYIHGIRQTYMTNPPPSNEFGGWRPIGGNFMQRAGSLNRGQSGRRNHTGMESRLVVLESQIDLITKRVEALERKVDVQQGPQKRVIKKKGGCLSS